MGTKLPSSASVGEQGGDPVLCRTLALLSGNARWGPELSCSGLWKQAWLCPLLPSPLSTPWGSVLPSDLWKPTFQEDHCEILWLWLTLESRSLAVAKQEIRLLVLAPLIHISPL